MVGLVSAAVGAKDASALVPFLPVSGTVTIESADSLSAEPPHVQKLTGADLLVYLRKLGEGSAGLPQRTWNGMEGITCDAACCHPVRSAGLLHYNLYLERVCIEHDARRAAVVKLVRILDGD